MASGSAAITSSKGQQQQMARCKQQEVARCKQQEARKATASEVEKENARCKAKLVASRRTQGARPS